jgi:hypothetical protein
MITEKISAAKIENACKNTSPEKNIFKNCRMKINAKQ